MTDKDLNIKYICERTLLDKDNKLVPIILDMIQESYKAGLCQAEYDNTMELLEENEELKSQLKGTTHCYDEEEHRKLQERIDLAIDYIKKYNVYFADCYEDKKGNIYSRDVEFVEIIPSDLLDILKGVSE